MLSGGMDSAVLLYQVILWGHPVRCITFDYGQRNIQEIEAARLLCARVGVDEHLVMSLPAFPGSALSDHDASIPEGHYRDPSMKAMVVPGRNAIMIAIAAGWAISTGARSVAFAAHAAGEGEQIYLDCSPAFCESMNEALQASHERGPTLMTPFIETDKIGICRAGLRLGVPFELTWTCYGAGSTPCGKCGTCVERAEAFRRCEVVDPLVKGT
jgi:7-cyano-7-deazaguanine synthase